MALSNLLDNALKFTPSSGRVTLGAREVAEGVQFWVEDTGPGVPPEDQPHVFERFYRGRNSRQGSGLGLALVRSVVEAHGGHVGLESEPGQGSLFWFVLPATI
jgi:signal transduction histidine kinase